MGIWSRGEGATAVRRALASVAVFAQLLLLLGPLVEVHGSGSGPGTLVVAGSASGSVLAARQPGNPTPHNATTCPACIAQSLHAQLASGVRIPTLVVAARAPTDLRPALLPHHDPPSTHHSRAPPVVS